MAVKLGELLLKAKLINGEQLAAALKLQKDSGVKLGEALVRLGFVSEDDITETLSAQFGVPSINLSHFEIDPNVLKLVPADVARKYNIPEWKIAERQRAVEFLRHQPVGFFAGQS